LIDRAQLLLERRLLDAHLRHLALALPQQRARRLERVRARVARPPLDREKNSPLAYAPSITLRDAADKERPREAPVD
jgi:hypothetical protein